MINLFNINNYQINTSDYLNFLHDKKVTEFEEKIADYVGAKYAVSFNSATSAIFLLLLGKKINVKVPSILPPVVVNAIVTSGNQYEFYDDIEWVGDSYILHHFENYKVVDSAQKLEKDQFKKECNPDDLMIFSFYPTKPIGSCDGGMIVSDDLNKILHLKDEFNMF
jgi:dTDP-4-amino-4,6-dideoxygalactose transaminase